ncbi:MAG: hypothetical protein K2H46_01760 [Muribaculaceae bacterium]|nr:hypothetical protein [Muribaculaceae bacterium]
MALSLFSDAEDLSEGTYRIFIFNPETDYALAAGQNIYNIPAKIKELRERMACCPAFLANIGDAILLLDSTEKASSSLSSAAKLINEKRLDIVSLPDIASYISEREKREEYPIFTPWGWNHTLRQSLLKARVESKFLKSEAEIESIRQLSHRRISSIFNEHLASILHDIDCPKATELYSESDALAFCRENNDVFLKAPWSSSGRGVVRSTSLDSLHLQQWIAGCIRRQGSVMGEISHNKTGDFATEWWIEKGKPHFLGLSMFKATPDGKYSGNIELRSKDIREKIKNLTSQWNDAIIEAQGLILEKLIAGNYSGPAGIDMLTTDEGNLVPCVEINLRFTMGMVTLSKSFRNGKE